jgi:hypothetical protein
MANSLPTLKLMPFFNKKDIRAEHFTMSVAATVVVAQENIEKSFTAYMPQLPANVDAEIIAAVGTNPLSTFEKARTEKSIVDSLIAQSTAELANSNVAANDFFGRNALAVDIKRSLVDFINIFQTGSRPGTPIEVYRSWEASVTAAYRVKILEEKIRILTEKSAVLTQTVATAQAEEDTRLAAEAAEQARVAAEAEAQRIAVEAAEQARLALRQRPNA